MMDNEKNFRRIVLLLILILLVVVSLIIARLAGFGTRKNENALPTEPSVTSDEESLGGRLPGEDIQESKEEESEAETSGEEESAQLTEADEALTQARRKREEDERYVEYRRNLARESLKKKKDKETSENCEKEQEEEVEEEPYVPPTILIVSDLHYMSAMTHDAGEAFINLMLQDDGKLIHCSDMILEALIDEAIERGVSALVMAGDNTYNGERANHEELARRLKRLKDAGIAVLLVPGNHDINDTNAAFYFGDEVVEAEYLNSADEYYEIYEEFYEGANSRDPNSLSYVYPLDETHWMMMLDSAWYEDRMHVDGRIRPETLLWMEQVFEAAEEVGASIIPVAHHNLLSESRVYTKECIMQNAAEVTELLEAHHLPLYLSGHLHAQRIKKHKSQPGVSDDVYGITEIVSSAVSIAPCQYGILSWDEDDSMHYQVYSLTDHMDENGDYMASHTFDDDSENESLTEQDDTLIQDSTMIQDDADTFTTRAEAFTKGVISYQIEVNFPNLPEDIRDVLGSSYADMYYLYCSGSYIDWDEFIRSTAYSLWQKFMQTDEYMQDMYEMSLDNNLDYHHWDHP